MLKLEVQVRKCIYENTSRSNSIEYDIVWKFPSQFLANVTYYIVFTFLKVHSIAYIIYYSLLMATFPLCQLSYSCIYYCHGTGYNSEMSTSKCVYMCAWVCADIIDPHVYVIFFWNDGKVMMTSLLFCKSHSLCFSVLGIMMEK